MIILQVVYRDRTHGLMFGKVKDRHGQLYCDTLAGEYGYHPNLTDNTKTHFGQFKLEIS